LPMLAQTYDLPASASQVPGITGMHHHALLLSSLFYS
jgi:hypothetical protein